MTLLGTTNELNRVWEGFSHYFLDGPLMLLDEADLRVQSEDLCCMVDIVGAVLCAGPRLPKEAELDPFMALPLGDWFRLATYMTVSIARGCVWMPDIAHKGKFELHSSDTFIHDDSIARPETQRDLLMALMAQVQEELWDEGALLLADSVDGLHSTIWRAHEGNIRAWCEWEVTSIYHHLSDICLMDILDKLEVEAQVEEITDLMWEEITQETWGKHVELIAQEKSCAFDQALKKARVEGLQAARERGAEEAAQKGQSYEKMLIDQANAESKIEADRIFHNKLHSVHNKMAQ
jgi:hypothetical protein